jgi:hypothetical protein
VKPGDFLLGVFDFFAILLPGSLATWLLVQYVPTGELARALSFGLGNGRPEAVVLAAAFLFSSYMLGHFVFMAGSRLDRTYDRWRTRTKSLGRDRTYKAARALQERLAKDLVGGEFTTLKWARAYVQVENAPARVEIDRLEAESKFFRSLVVVLVAFAGHFLLREQAPAVGVVSLVLAALSYERYCEQRWKMTELSYGTAVIVHAARLRA